MKVQEMLRGITEAVEMYEEAILVWTTTTAPGYVWNVIEERDDIEWIAFVPSLLGDWQYPFPAWVATPSFAPCEMKRYPTSRGTLYVGYRS